MEEPAVPNGRDHRPWLAPPRPWMMRQVWHDLMFMHWPVSIAQLRPLIPSSLHIDTYEGQAWLAVVPFRMSGIRPRFLPTVPWLSAFPELNVRTYVVAEDKPGVWFFSLEAANLVAVAVARWWYLLPYFYAQMSCVHVGESIYYESRRIHRGVPAAAFSGQYHPVSDVFSPTGGSFEYWLTERYCLYTADAQQRLYRGEIDHPPWSLQVGEATIRENTMTLPIDIQLADTLPLLHFARRQDVHVWSLERVSK